MPPLRTPLFLIILCLILFGCYGEEDKAEPLENFSLSVRQITQGPRHHLFGYIGQSKTIPWNAGGRYILGLETDFHDHLPGPGEPARIILVDTQQQNQIEILDETLGWNHQQGTMFYWNPAAPETQFFFNDHDPATGKIFTVLFDIEEKQRIREYRFPDTPVASGGVAPAGGVFLAINYARMARLRPVTGYQGAVDWTTGVAAPEDDGVHIVDTETGEKMLVVSFRQIADALRPEIPEIDEIPLFINHTLWNRNSDRIWFFARGNWNELPPGVDRIGPRVNQSFTVRPDGTELTRHEHIGGHPEWGEDNTIYGVKDGRQVLYDVDAMQVVDTLGDASVFPDPEGDISLSPDGKYFANGYDVGDTNYYVVYRLADGKHVRSEGFGRGPYVRGDLRIDPAPRWNRTSDAILVPGWTAEDNRQMHVIEIIERRDLDDALAEADSIVAASVASGEASGAVLLIAKNGEILHLRAHGYAQRYAYGGGLLDIPIPMRTDQVFDLASLTKVFATTFGVMLMVDEGKIDLDEPVKSYLPAFTGPHKDSVTVQHLLTHTAGLHPWKPTYYHASDNREVLDYISRLELAYPVGEARHYSDLGFMLLGYIIEERSGQRLDVYLAERLYRPLGLMNTGFNLNGLDRDRFAATSHGNPFEKRMVADDDFGYVCDEDPDSFTDWRERVLVGEVNDGNAFYAHGGVAGHAGLFSTASELNVLLELLQNRGVYKGRQLISRDVLVEFLTAGKKGNGPGWGMSSEVLLIDDPPPGTFGHTGFTGTYALGVPAYGLNVVLLTNRQHAGVGPDGTYPSVNALRKSVAETVMKALEP